MNDLSTNFVEKQLIYDCIKPLQKNGDPIIIVAAVGEAEIVANVCRENGITISAICDNISKVKLCIVE